MNINTKTVCHGDKLNLESHLTYILKNERTLTDGAYIFGKCRPI